MAIFSFPTSPTLNQTYLGPNGVLYTWDGEKWVGSGAGGTSVGDWLDKTPIPGNQQTITPGQVTDRALGLVALPGQAGNLFEIVDATTGLPITVIDEEGNLGIGTASPIYPAEIYGGLLFTGPLLAQGTAGLPGQHLVTDGIKAYWANETRWDLNAVLAAGNVSTYPMTVGDMNVRGNLTVTGTQTIVNTEVIKLADNIITLNSNYTGNTPNENAGLEVNRGTLAAKYFFWDETLDKWSIGTETFKAGLFEGNLLGNVTGTVSSLANHTTNALPEGTNNLYFTNARARNALTVTGDLQYNRNTGVLHYDTPVRSVNNMTGHVVLTTDDIPEGQYNKYGFSANVAWDWFQTVKLQDLGDVDDAPAANGDILYFDGVTQTWKLRAGDFEDNFVSSGAFDANTGNLVHTRNDGNSISVNLDGRYLQLETGGTLKGPLFGIESYFDYVNAQQGLVANNAVIQTSFESVGPAVFDDAATFKGATKVLLAPVATTDVTNKLYVDQLVANSEVFTANATFTTATGSLIQTRTDGSIYTVNLDGRYIILPTAPVNGQMLTFNGSTWVATNAIRTLDDLTNVTAAGAANGDILYYDGASASWRTIPGDFIDNFLSSAAFSASTGVVTLTRNDGNTITVDLDGRYLELTAGGTVTGPTIFTGGVQSTTTPVTANDVTNKAYVDGLVANAEVTINSFTITGANLTIGETNGNSHTVDLSSGLDARYVNVTGDTVTGPLTVTGLMDFHATTLVLNDLADVDVSAATAGSLLAYDNNTSSWKTISINDVTPDTYTVSAVIDPATGVLTQTHNTGTSYDVNLFAGLDARYVNVAGDIITGPLIANANVEIKDTLIASNTTLKLDNLADVDTTGVANGSIIYFDAVSSTWKIIAGDFIDNFITAASFSNLDGVVSLTRNDGNTITVDIDGRYLELVNGGTVTGNTVFNNKLQTPTVPTIGNDVTNKTYVDALVANAEIFTSNATFNTATGILTQTRNNGTTYAVGLDGRYVRSVNGVLPDTGGNVLINLTTTLTGADSAKPGSANAGVIYIVSGDPNPDLNGETFIYVVGSGWQQVTPLDTATYDARYVNVTGDTMTGSLVLAGDPTANLQAATKQYVDALVANAEVFTSNATFNTTDGVLTQTRNNGTTYTVDLDGRYLELTAGGTVTGNTVFNGKLQTPTTPTANTDVANKLYVDSLVANAEVFTSNAVFNTTDGIVTLTRNNGTTYTVDLDGRYLELTNGGTVTGNTVFNGNLQTPTVPTANNDVANKLYVDSLVANAEVFTSNATFNAADGVLTQTRNNGTTYTVDLDGRYLELTNGGTVAGPTIFNNTLQTPTAPTTANDVTNKAYVDALVANSEVTVNTFVFTPADGNLVITETDGSVFAVDLDGRYLELAAGGTVTGNTVFNGKLQTPTAPTSNNDVANKLYVDSLVANSEVTINGFTFNGADGNLVITETNGNTHAVDLDSRYIPAPSPATTGQVLTYNGTTWAAANVAANLADLGDVDVTGVANGDILYWNAATTKWEVIAGDFGDNFINTATFNAGDGIVTITRNDGNTFTFDLDGRYLELANGGIVTGPTLYTGGLQSNVVPVLGDDVTNKTYVDALVANAEIFTSNATFDATTGVITQTRNNGTTYAVDIDGRYARTVNGIVPDTNGNIAVSLTAVQTGDFASRPATANAGVVYVVSGETGANTNNNGKTYIFEAVSAAWYEVKGFDEAAADARYVNISGDTMAGDLSLVGNPTANMHAATKEYVDLLVANSEIFTSNATLDAATGLLTQTRNDGSTYTVNLFTGLDGRYVNVTGDTMTGDLAVTANVTIGGTLDVHSTTLLLDELADVDTTGLANGEVLTYNNVSGKWESLPLPAATIDTYVATAAFGTGDGIVTLTRNDGNTVTVDLDGRYLELVNGGTVTGNTIFNGNLQTPTAPTSNNDVANKLYVDSLVANSEVTINGFTFSAADGNLVITETNGNTHAVDLDSRYVVLPSPATANQVLTFDGTTWIAANVAANLADLGDVDVTGVANGDILYYNAATTKWEVIAGDFIDNFITSGTLQANGQLDLARNDGNTVSIDLDGVWLSLVDGGTVTGNTIFNGNLQTPTAPTSNNDVANKLYVDSLVANSEVTINGFTFGLADGNLVITETNGNTHAIDLDGRYLELANGGIVTGPTLYTGGLQSNVAPTTGDDVTNKTYVDALVANSEVSINGFTFGLADGNLVITETNGNTHAIDLDGRYLELANGGIVTGPTLYTGGLQSNVAPTTGDDVTNKTYVDALVANSEIFTSNAVFDITTGVITQTRTDLTTYTVDIDGRYVIEPTPTANGQVLTWNNVTNVWEAQTPAAGVTQLALLTDVDVTGVANGDILYYNAATSKWDVIAGDFIDNFVTSGSFAAANGDVTLTRNDGNTIVYNMDGRYLELVDGGTVTGNTIFNGNLQTPTVPTSNNDVANKLYVDSLVANSEVTISNFAFTSTDGNLVITETNGNTHAVDLDGRWIVQPTATANGQTLTWNNVTNLWEAQTPATGVTQLSLLTDVNVAGVANGQFLTYDSATSKWVPTTQVENYTANATFDPTTGVVTQTRIDGTTYTVDLDGRYAQSVNGVVPDAAGNVLLNLTTTMTGDANSKPTTANGGLVYVVSGDANTDLNGETYIYVVGSGWQQVTPLDTATYDARYVNVTGDTMTGFLTLNANPTANLHAATKEYVDLLVANSEVYTSNATFDVANGILTQTRTDSTTYSVDLDGRWIVQPTATSNGQVLTWNNVTNLWEAQTSAAGVTTLALLTDVNVTGVSNGQVLYYNSATTKWEPKVDKYVASGAIAVANNTALIATLTYSDATTANVDITHGITNHTDVDTLTVAPANNNVLTWDATKSLWVPKSVSHVTIADVAPTAPAEGDLWYDSATNFRTYVWSTVAASWLDVAPSAAGTTIKYIDDLLDVNTPTKIAGQSLLAWDGVNWVAVSVLDASDGTIDDF